MYDLSKPHLKLVGKNQPAIIVQGGVAFEHGSRRSLGPVRDLIKEKVVGKHDHKLCGECGGSFTSNSGLEEHFVRTHRDIIMAKVMESAPKGIKGIWTPTEEMVDEMAKALVLADSDEPAKKASADGKKPWREKA